MVEKAEIKVNEKGLMIVSRAGFGDEHYDMTEVPSADTFLVQREKKEILKTLSLQNVLTGLNRASDLLFLAYNGVVGTGQLHARISNRQMELSKLCADCVLTMTKLEDNSHLVLQRLTEAYRYLLKANEPRALTILARCAGEAGEMSASCANLAVNFGKLADDTKEDAEKAAMALGQQVKKMHELDSLRTKMQANKRRQEEESKQLEVTIKGLEAEIKDEKARVEVAEKRAFYSHIVSSALHACTLGFAAPKAYKTSARRDSSNHQQPRSSSLPSGGNSSNFLDEQVQQLKTKEEDATKALEDAESKREYVRSKKVDLHNSVVDAKAVGERKQKLLDAAIAGDKAEAGYTEKVKEAKEALEASTENLKSLQHDLEKAEKDLKAAQTAENDAAAKLSAAAESLKSITQPASQMSQAREIASNINGMKMYEQKLLMEQLRRESIGLLAELTSLLGASTRETEVEASAQVALEIASWALSSVFTALSEAKLFWDNMKWTCEKLAKSEVIQQIKDNHAENKDAPDARIIEEYRSSYFVKKAMTYVAKWAALTAVCGEYVEASELARQSVLGHIRAAPSIEQARLQVGPLKEKLLKVYEIDAMETAVKIDEIKAQIEETGASTS